MDGKFNLWYAITGKKPGEPAQPWSEDYKKALGIGIKLAVVIFLSVIFIIGTIGIGRSIWNFFKPKKAQPSVSTTIQGPTDSATQNIKYTVVQLGNTDKPPVRIIPYIDCNTGYGNGRDKYFSSNYGWEAKAGLRFEMDGLLEKLFMGKKSMTQEVQTAIIAADALKDPKKEIADKTASLTK